MAPLCWEADSTLHSEGWQAGLAPPVKKLAKKFVFKLQGLYRCKREYMMVFQSPRWLVLRLWHRIFFRRTGSMV